MAFYDKNGKKVYFQRLDPSVLDNPAVKKFRRIRSLIWIFNISITMIIVMLVFLEVL